MGIITIPQIIEGFWALPSIKEIVDEGIDAEVLEAISGVASVVTV